MRVLVLSSLAYSLVNFRGALLERMARDGHSVICAAPDPDAAVQATLSGLGIAFELTPMQRTGRNPFRDIRLLANYAKLIRKHRPDVILAYTQKPIIYGGLAARLTGVGRFYALMSGLGHAFSPDAAISRWLRAAIARLYRAGIRRAHRIFVFNSADRQDMIALGIIDRRQPVSQVPGSGVDVRKFAFVPVPPGNPHFLMIARLMRDKGVMEFLEAARLVARNNPHCRFSILGHFETENPTGLGEEECIKLAEEFPVRFLSPTNDVRPALANCSVFVLPSYYREGLPRTILEALATGRPVITTNTPGCRDAIADGETGFVIPPREVEPLRQAMVRFLKDPQLAVIMGARARRRAEEVYDVHRVNEQVLGAMGLSSPAGIDTPQASERTSSLKPADLASQN